MRCRNCGAPDQPQTCAYCRTPSATASAPILTIPQNITEQQAREIRDAFKKRTGQTPLILSGGAQVVMVGERGPEMGIPLKGEWR